MSYLDQIHQREAAEERTVETPKTEETVSSTATEETVTKEPPKTEETVTETPKAEETVTETPKTEDKAETEKKQPKDLSGISKEEKAAYAFRRQMAKRESKFEEALKSRDSEIDNLKKAIADLQAPKEKKSRKDFENDDGYIDYLASQRVDAKWAEKEAKSLSITVTNLPLPFIMTNQLPSLYTAQMVINIPFTSPHLYSPYNQ